MPSPLEIGHTPLKSISYIYSQTLAWRVPQEQSKSHESGREFTANDTVLESLLIPLAIRHTAEYAALFRPTRATEIKKYPVCHSLPCTCRKLTPACGSDSMSFLEQNDDISADDSSTSTVERSARLSKRGRAGNRCQFRRWFAVLWRPGSWRKRNLRRPSNADAPSRRQARSPQTCKT